MTFKIGSHSSVSHQKKNEKSVQQASKKSNTTWYARGIDPSPIQENRSLPTPATFSSNEVNLISTALQALPKNKPTLSCRSDTTVISAKSALKLIGKKIPPIPPLRSDTTCLSSTSKPSHKESFPAEQNRASRPQNTIKELKTRLSKTSNSSTEFDPSIPLVKSLSKEIEQLNEVLEELGVEPVSK
ncbi:MAG: hypothetical protein LBC45_00480 [Chlamydiales bacterium]|jgi:hypothetical protein|nr:hypothetical protein [Chlamydiales bacterium]